MPALTEGKSAPQVSLPDTGGKTFSLKDALQRGPAVLAFFKITCPVCQFTIPLLERMHQAYPGATIVGISQNPRQDTERFLREYGITFPTLLDDPAKYAASNAYGLTNVPTIFFVSQEGEIEISCVGWSRKEVEQMSSRIAKSLGKKPAQLFKPGEDIPDFKAG